MTVYLTRYDGLLCAKCALDTSDLLDDGTRWLDGLTAVAASDVLAEWPDACCEECRSQVVA
jgi:hypothetical protein